jgi:protease-4
MKKRNWIRHRPLFATPPEARKPNIAWWILPILWIALRRTCTALGAFVLVMILLGFYVASNFTDVQPESLPREMVLYLPLDEDPGEIPARSGPFSEDLPTVHDLVNAIDRATLDKRVKGMYARMDEGTYSMARTDELRGAIKRFRAAGKFAYIYSPSYGQGAGDLGRYYLASAFQEIWMQPLGVLSIAGVRAEVPFLRDTLDKIGIYPQFYKRKEYKTAYESLTHSEMSPENRQEIEDLVGDIRANILKDIPADREITPEAFEQLVDHGLFTAPEALNAKLITNADYADILVERIKTDVTGDPDADDDLFVDPVTYMESASWEDREHRFMDIGSSRPSVALIYVVGAIMDTGVGNGTAAADEIAPAILDAADDDEIQAIVLRIDSPGGSPVASESILRAVERAKQKGKPVIVSMGPTAASGGYWVAAYADQIFALPATLTGSIGVLGGKISADALWKKLGVKWNKDIKWGENSGLWSVNTPFSKTEEERINAMLDNVYAAFIERVSKGRGMTIEQVDKVAHGRVWSGTKAVELGLADQIGGLREALDYTAKILGAEDKTGIDVVVLPEAKSPIERFMDLMDEQGSVYEGMKFQQRIAAFLAPALQSLAVLQNSHGAAAYEPLRIE